jgi:hypothetical protein
LRRRRVAPKTIVNPTTERRRYPRLEILGRIKGVVRPLDVPITLLNLSLGGFLMQTPMEYRVGEIHEFQFTMGDKEPLIVRARIAHAMRATVDHEPVYLFGLEFVDRDTRTADEPMQSLVSALMASGESTDH